MAVAMATVARLKGSRSATRLVDYTLLSGWLRAGVGEGLEDDTEGVVAGLCHGGGVGRGGGVALWHP